MIDKIKEMLGVDADTLLQSKLDRIEDLNADLAKVEEFKKEMALSWQKGFEDIDEEIAKESIVSREHQKIVMQAAKILKLHKIRVLENTAKTLNHMKEVGADNIDGYYMQQSIKELKQLCGDLYLINEVLGCDYEEIKNLCEHMSKHLKRL